MKQLIEYDVKSRDKERYYGIDILKFICAFLVVAIHVKPFSEDVFANANALNFLFPQVLCRIAVPFYFAASGFLLFRNMDSRPMDWMRIQKYCFKLLRLYGLWSLLLIVGGNGHLWYLGATVVGIICLSLCFHLGIKFEITFLLSVILYVVGLLGDSYYGLLEQLRSFAVIDYAAKGYEYFFRNTRNGLFMGMPFLLIGAVFAVKKVRIKPVLAITGFIISVALLILEAYTLEYYEMCRDHNMFLALIPATFFLFALAVYVDLPKSDRYERLQSVGSLIYYMHMMIFSIIAPVFSLLSKYMGINLFPFEFGATVAVTLAVAVLVWTISRYNKFAWVQYLYR